jgi:glycogen debranching enzyme
LEDIIRVENQFYVLATSSLADDRTRVLKYGETFAVLNRLGDIEGIGVGEQGLYHRGTRYLSKLVLRLNGTVPQLLRSTIHEDGAFFTIDMMNPDIYREGHLILPRSAIHVFRSKFLWKDACYERIRVANFGLAPFDASIGLQFVADYADIFQVRGMERLVHGDMLPPQVNDHEVVLSYRGQDRVLRRSRLAFFPDPAHLSAESATYSFILAPREEKSLNVTVTCQEEQEHAHGLSTGFDESMHQSILELQETRSQFCSVTSSHAAFNRWLCRSASDVQMMIRGNPEGAYPYAGVPWFSTVFGRDALVTAMQCLWAAPWIAESVLKYLALHQAVEVNPRQEAEPGKILHEMRHGEMANLKEVPFGLYYGSVDSTPLFVLLAGMYFDRTGDKDFLQSIWPNVLAALDWIDQYGDADHDGFVEYQARSKKGLIHQGWKDSHDAVFHSDGTLADAPIALCEVQAYVYGARLAAARIAGSFGQAGLAHKLIAQARSLQQKFESEFWDDHLGSYVLALDANKKPCRVRTSNAGQALFTGVVSPERAARLAATLLDENLFCGWGIRTVASNEIRYNPMSYHNGSVWPHDNSLIAAGLARYGYKEQAGQLLAAILEASTFMELNRLPELFCGFHKRPGVEGPTLYPVACSPQAWSAGAAYLFVDACLGMSFSVADKTLHLSKPHLPPTIDEIKLADLRIGNTTMDLKVHRNSGGITAEILHSHGEPRLELEA